MALLNPVYGLIVPFLFVVTIPLAVFAGVTTVLAFSVLMFRVSIVYLDIGLHMISQYASRGPVGPGRPRGYTLPRGYDAALMTTTPATPATPASASGQSSPGSASSRSRSSHQLYAGGGLGISHYRQPQQPPPQPRRHRRPSAGSAAGGSVGTATPVGDGGGGGGGGVVVLRSSSSGLDRDFEGVGGWRLDDRGSDEDWTRINSRLELPLDRAGKHHHHQQHQQHQQQHHHHHHRSPSGGGGGSGGGPTTPGEGGWLMMKPSAGPRLARAESGGSPPSPPPPPPDGAVPGGGRGSSSRGSSKGGSKPRDKAPQHMSPNSSRMRMPTGAPSAFTARDREEGGYFPPVLGTPKPGRKAVA